MASSAIHHPNQYFEEGRQVAQEGHSGTPYANGVAPSILNHSGVNVKKELTNTSDADIGDFPMDEDDEILGEIEGMDNVQ